ncbi:putative alcohol dehydrogenase [Actinoplanes missouriensis 431]|uniref:Alcohol dehydrogenase n=1 Tax=Actinoplanes missouriensis (strain ATCC 14538 / DSM 43046 / CBS 188.64 / JCM 3121 / NBRC 102363 / NCIMB 12654 / NRRL B-3342 / UNCC 431) TaxID=512565 RepID=I0HA11_ACTM4|nr:alcohol dehydrogenase catalytic domain-containing protein [Actinoplanes missouriensis]BAL89848.1 putative alcohol dehydrogenase [Actinoplanes missouriensis 431]
MTGAYRAMTVTGHRRFEMVERVRRAPAPDEVRIEVEACGICHTDALAVDGQRADPSVPLVPGHEIIGVISAAGDRVDPSWRIGDRVGVGFLGGQDNTCESCRRGDFLNCADQPLTGTSVDGGYAEVAYARATGLVRIPPELNAVDGAPLLCAGLTVYNPLLRARVRPGSLVAIQGIGGLGHLGIQYARALGHRVAAIGRGSAKAELAHRLGAEFYLDSTAEDPGAALQRLGGTSVIVATAAAGDGMSGLVKGLLPRGELIVVGAGPDPLRIAPTDLIFGGHAVRGSLTGTAVENEDNIAFALRHDVRSWNEVLPLSEAPKAYDRMINGDARFRIVLDMSA